MRAAADPHRSARGEYDYQNKYFTDDTKYICPCGLPAQKEEALKALALEAFEALVRRLGARRPDAGREGRSLAAGSQHLARHDRPQPGADGGEGRGISYEDLCVEFWGRPWGITPGCST
jgi:D-alanine-D-alanine ligase